MVYSIAELGRVRVSFDDGTTYGTTFYLDVRDAESLRDQLGRSIASANRVRVLFKNGTVAYLDVRDAESLRDQLEWSIEDHYEDHPLDRPADGGDA